MMLQGNLKRQSVQFNQDFCLPNCKVVAEEKAKCIQEEVIYVGDLSEEALEEFPMLSANSARKFSSSNHSVKALEFLILQ